MTQRPFFPLPRRRLLAGAAAALLPTLPLQARAEAQAPPRRVLLMSTNVARVGSNTSGTFLVEIAMPYQRFREAGFAVDVATPAGGPAALYDRQPTSDALRRIQADPGFAAATSHTLPAASLRAADYAGLYYPGGHGQYFDVVGHAATAAFAMALHARGGVIGAAGHGTASLVDLQHADGRFFVQGKRMTCFPTWAEKRWMNISGYGRLLPFDMQERLQERGALLTVCTEATRSDLTQTLVSDDAQRLVTGSFAESAGDVALQMLRLMGASPATQPAATPSAS